MAHQQKLFSELYVYPNDSNYSEIFSEGYNIHKRNTNTEPIHSFQSIVAKVDAKTLVNKTNPIVRLYPKCSIFIGIMKMLAEPQKTINIMEKSQSMLIFERCEVHSEKVILPDLKPLKLGNFNIEDLNIDCHRLD